MGWGGVVGWSGAWGVGRLWVRIISRASIRRRRLMTKLVKTSTMPRRALPRTWLSWRTV